MIQKLPKLNVAFLLLCIVALSSPAVSREQNDKCSFLQARGAEYLSSLKHWEEVELQNYVNTGSGDLDKIEDRIFRFAEMANRYANLLESYCPTDEIKGCMCSSDNIVVDAFLRDGGNIISFSICEVGSRKLCPYDTTPFRRHENLILFEPKTSIGARNLWSVNLDDGTALQTLFDKNEKAIGGDRCTCKFDLSVTQFMDELIEQR